MNPLRIPFNVSLDWLRSLTGLVDWVFYEDSVDLGEDSIATLRVHVESLQATILFNSRFAFSEAARMEAIVHELYELSLYAYWQWSIRILREYILEEIPELLEESRYIRDTIISKYMDHIRFWPYEMPVRIPNVHIPKDNADSLSTSNEERNPML